MRRRRPRATYLIRELDRQLAESEAIRRSVAAGRKRVRVESCERLEFPEDPGVWEIVVSFNRARRGP